MKISSLPIFYSKDIESSLSLSENESRHCIKVLRMKIGDNICVTDGQGFFYNCKINQITKSNCFVHIMDKKKWNKPWHNIITLAIAPTKNGERMDWMIEKLVEVGIDRIVFFSSDHSERRIVNIDRLNRVAISAMKQSQKAILPIIESDYTFNDILSIFGNYENKMIAHCMDSHPRIYSPTDLLNKCSGNNIIIVGPEGDFSYLEISKAIEYGFTPITLGESRLRTETAGLYAISWIHILGLKK